MFRAKYQALKILEILIDYRSSLRLQHLLSDFKAVRPAVAAARGPPTRRSPPPRRRRVASRT